MSCFKANICSQKSYLLDLFSWKSQPAIKTVMCNTYLFSSQRFRGYILALERQTLTFKRPEGLRGYHLWPPNSIHSLLVLCVKHFCWHFAMWHWWVNLAAECVIQLHPHPCRFSEKYPLSLYWCNVKRGVLLGVNSWNHMWKHGSFHSVGCPVKVIGTWRILYLG